METAEDIYHIFIKPTWSRETQLSKVKGGTIKYLKPQFLPELL